MVVRIDCLEFAGDSVCFGGEISGAFPRACSNVSLLHARRRHESPSVLHTGHDAAEANLARYGLEEILPTRNRFLRARCVLASAAASPAAARRRAGKWEISSRR